MRCRGGLEPICERGGYAQNWPGTSCHYAPSGGNAHRRPPGRAGSRDYPFQRLRASKRTTLFLFWCSSKGRRRDSRHVKTLRIPSQIQTVTNRFAMGRPILCSSSASCCSPRRDFGPTHATRKRLTCHRHRDPPSTNLTSRRHRDPPPVP
jgi:hypothetical protein